MEKGGTPIPFAPLRLCLHPGGHRIDLTAPRVVLGRHSDADLRMPMPDVSRHHCQFQHSNEGWMLVDLDSLNGVYVNGQRVQRSLLQIGDQIRICGIEFDVEAPAIGAQPAERQKDILRDLAEILQNATVHRRAS